MQKTLDKLASGFDAFITTNRGLIGEAMAANRDIAASLQVISRALSDRGVLNGGSTAMPVGTAVHADEIAYVERMQGRVDANRRGVVRASPETDRRAGLMDFTLDPNKPLGGQTRSNVRKNVFNVVSARAEGAAQANTDWQWVNGGGRVLLNDGYTIDEFGRYRTANGRYASAQDAVAESMSEREGNSLVRRAAMLNTAARVSKSFSEGAPVGRSLLSALPQGALKAAGIAGAVTFAGDKLIDTVQDQAAILRGYQGVYGGGLMDQWDDRASQWINRNIRGRFSMLGGEAYDQLFKSGMNLGLRGDDRSQFIQTGANIIGQTGASSEFASRVMTVAVEAGLGLQGLAESIKNVSNAAKDAGINANRAREVFLKNFEAGAEVMFGSQGAKAFAEYMTVGQLGQARPYQNINQMGAFQDRRLTTGMAFSLGMTPSQLQVAQREAPGASIGMAEQYARDQAKSLVPDRPGGRSIEQVVNDFIAERKASGFGYDPALDQVALGEALVAEGYDENRLADFLKRMGYSNITPGTAPGFLGNLFVNGSSPGSIAVQSEAERAALYSQTSFETRTVTPMGGRNPNVKPYQVATNLPFDIPQMRARGAGRGALQDAYYSLINGSGVYNESTLAGATRRPILEQLILSEGIRPGKTKVRVATADGPKVVSLEEALRDFPDQLESGEAKFVEGVDEEMLGKSTIDGLGVSKEVSEGISVTSNSKRIDYGEDYEKYRQKREEKEREGESGGGDQRVTLDLTPEAKRLLVPINDPYYDPSAPFYNGTTMGP